MKKILFLIHDLQGGGAEKVLVNLVNNMDHSCFDITVMTLFDVGVNRQFLSKDVSYRYAFKKMLHGNSHLMKLLTPQQLYRWVVPEGYDIVVSFLEGPCARIVSGCRDAETKIVSWVHSTLHDKNEIAASFRNFKEAKKCYQISDMMVFVSDEARRSFLKACPVTCKTAVLYNTNESKKIIESAAKSVNDIQFEKDTFYWCGIGKLMQNKGFDRMLRILKRLIQEGYQTKLLILGVGEKEAELKKWAGENGISDYVLFMGYQTNPYKYLARCDLFVCASHEEGFSTAATESLIVGTPVCTVWVSGMQEMLGDSEYGLITENDEDSLYRGIKSLVDNPGLLHHYKEQAIARGKAFNTENTVQAVENMFEKL